MSVVKTTTAPVLESPAALINTDNLVITGGSFSQVVTIYQAVGLPMLGLDMLRSAITIGAMHDSRERLPVPKCFQDTHIEIRETIMEWAKKDNHPSILCISGPAKCGKSAIAHHVADGFSHIGTLAGSFFFDAAKSQDDGDFLLTIAYQIAINLPGMDRLINTAILRDPTLLKKSGKRQLSKLILEPLFCLPAPSTPYIVVVDAFEQCDSFETQREVMELLSRSNFAFGQTLRFVIFYQEYDDRDLHRDLHGPLFSSVGRHISLEETSRKTHYSLNEKYTSNHLGFMPYLYFESDQLSFKSNTFYDFHQVPRNPLCNPYTMYSIGPPHEVLPGSVTQGSPMVVDILRNSPMYQAGSPMVIDSLKSSPYHGGSPMHLDPINMNFVGHHIYEHKSSWQYSRPEICHANENGAAPFRDYIRGIANISVEPEDLVHEGFDEGNVVSEVVVGSEVKAHM